MVFIGHWLLAANTFQEVLTQSRSSRTNSLQNVWTGNQIILAALRRCNGRLEEQSRLGGVTVQMRNSSGGNESLPIQVKRSHSCCTILGIWSKVFCVGTFYIRKKTAANSCSESSPPVSYIVLERRWEWVIKRPRNQALYFNKLKVKGVQRLRRVVNVSPEGGNKSKHSFEGIAKLRPAVLLSDLISIIWRVWKPRILEFYRLGAKKKKETLNSTFKKRGKKRKKHKV